MDDLSRKRTKELASLLRDSKDNGDEALKKLVVDEYHKRFLNSHGDNALMRRIIDDLTSNGCPLIPEEQHLADQMNQIPTTPAPPTDSLASPPRRTSNASLIGSAFTNPYTFMPFPENSPVRKDPTPLTACEEFPERLSGILEFEVVTESPLLSLEAVASKKTGDHQHFKALRAGKSVIYPATGVRGAIRNLMTLLTGGCLRYLDKESYLCDSRWNSNEKQTKNLQLALIIKPGNRNTAGIVRLGKQEPVLLTDLPGITQEDRESRDPIWIRWDSRSGCIELRKNCKERPEGFERMLKLSGRPVQKKMKREWVFLPDPARDIVVPPELWSAYHSRYQHGPINHAELRKNQLIWLEPTEEGEDFLITRTADVQSLQYARWGKEGDQLSAKVPLHVHPSYMTGEQVDEVTDLFGQVPPDEKHAGKAPSFAGRLRPDNLVFPDAVQRLLTITMAPLMPPHPSCRAFYRNTGDRSDMLRGYKVYRTTSDTGSEAPMHYDQQPVMKDGIPLDCHQRVNKTAEVLPEGVKGNLSIAFRALTKREFALLRMVTEMPLRLGGGKPFGMGLCRLRLSAVRDEQGREIDNPVENWKDFVKDIKDRMQLYLKSQEKIGLLRYPRCAEENNNTMVRAGHVWFNRFASATGDGRLRKLQVEKGSSAAGKLDGAISLDAQPLPALHIDEEEQTLYGFDVMLHMEEYDRVRLLTDFEPFNPEKHIKEKHSSGTNVSMNRDKRQKSRQER